MPADTLSREEIEQMRDLANMLDAEARATATEFGVAERLLRVISRVGPKWTELIDHALSEPARLASARAEGVREGIEMAAHALDDRVHRLRAFAATLKGAETVSHFYARAEAVESAASVVRALSPPPAEPTGMTDDGWIEWKGGECPVPADTIIEARLGSGATLRPQQAHKAHWGRDPRVDPILAYRIVKPAAEPSTPVAPDWPTRCAALEADGIAARRRVAELLAENAKLRAIVKELDDALGEDDGEYPDDKPMTLKCGRWTYYSLSLGLLRRARSILQGGHDAAA